MRTCLGGGWVATSAADQRRMAGESGEDRGDRTPAVLSLKGQLTSLGARGVPAETAACGILVSSMNDRIKLAVLLGLLAGCSGGTISNGDGGGAKTGAIGQPFGTVVPVQLEQETRLVRLSQ